jgi:hypothetical protein
LKVIATRHLNLHSASVEGGLVHVPAKRAVIVPNDIADHRQFKLLRSDGTLTVLDSGARMTDSYQTLAAKAKIEQEKKEKKASKAKKAGADEDDAGEKLPAPNQSNIPQGVPVEDVVDEDEDEDDEDEDEDDEDEDEDDEETEVEKKENERNAGGRGK